MTVALGLDLSLTSTGWAVWGGDGGRIRTDLAAQRWARYAPISRRRYIADEVHELAHPHDSVLAVIEKSYIGAVNPKTGIDLAMLHAVVLDHLPWTVEGIVYVRPATAKKHLAGKGDAGKDEMIEAAQAVGYPGEQTDEADAWGLALLGHHLLGGTDHMTPHRASCLAAAEWVVPMPVVEVAG